MQGHGKRHWWMERAPSPLRLTQAPRGSEFIRESPRSTHPAYTVGAISIAQGQPRLPQKAPPDTERGQAQLSDRQPG